MQAQTTGKLNIRVAVYGLKVVTNNIIKLISDGDVQTLSFVVNNKSIKEDGWQGQVKTITIVGSYDDGPLFTVTAKEGELISIDEKQFAKSRLTPKPIQVHKQKLTVLAATYGPDDVTYKIKNIVNAKGILSCRADNTVFGDSWYGIPKTLIVIMGLGDDVTLVEMFIEREHCYIDLNDFSLADYSLLIA